VVDEITFSTPISQTTWIVAKKPKSKDMLTKRPIEAMKMLIDFEIHQSK
jgi:hypothetical protein